MLVATGGKCVVGLGTIVVKWGGRELEPGGTCGVVEAIFVAKERN